MRTDSVNLSGQAIAAATDLIKRLYGVEYSHVRKFKTKSAGAQEAHEAIRPTDLAQLPANLKTELERSQARVYDLIWKRTLACQMTQAIFDQTTVEIKAGDKHQFKATGQVVKFDGFIRAYTEGTDETAEDEIEGVLPELEVGEKLDLHKLSPLQHFTEPPARYTDATLIKALEAHGVGRPSTYAPTLSTIQERDYVKKEDKKYHPTETGIIVNDMLVENFPEIVDINFTSQVEEQFDDIAEGKREWVPVLREFYGPFKSHLEEKEKTVEKPIIISDTPCPHCGKPMLIKFGRMGQFLACPEEGSKVTLPMPEEAAKIKELEEKTKGEMCPICGKPMEVKRGRFGFFLGCQDYPKCKGISKIWNKTGFKCPNCLDSADRKDKPGDVVEKKSRGRGKPFFACTRWPDCELIMNKKPETQEELMELYKNWKENPPKPKEKKEKKKEAAA
jgi:DNA topoisomerase-1